MEKDAKLRARTAAAVVVLLLAAAVACSLLALSGPAPRRPARHAVPATTVAPSPYQVARYGGPTGDASVGGGVDGGGTGAW